MCKKKRDIDFKRIKAVALDLDGTLLNTAGKISEGNKAAIWEVRRRGIEIILASGRPLAGIRTTARAINLAGLDGYIIGANGGTVVSAGNGEILLNKTVPMDLYGHIKDFVRQWPGTGLLTYDDQCMRTDKENPYMLKIARGLDVSIKPMGKLDYPVAKFIITGEKEVLVKAASDLKSRFACDLKCVYGGENFIEIMPYGVSKAAGMRTLLQHLKEKGKHITPAEVMCCGDSANDLELMDLVGLPVAMDNASEEIKNHGAYITAHCNQDGVAKAILRIGC